MNIFDKKQNNQKNILINKLENINISYEDYQLIEQYYIKDKNFRYNVQNIILTILNKPETNFTPLFCDVFNILNDESLDILISSFTNNNTALFNFNKILSINQNKNLITLFLNMIVKNDFVFLEDVKSLIEFYFNNILKLDLLDKNGIRNYLFYFSFTIFSNNEIIKKQIINYKDLLVIYRNKIFSDTKEIIIYSIEYLLNNQNEDLDYNEKINNIINWDLWKYCNTNTDIESILRDFIKSLIENNYDGTEIFNKLNEISNKTFKNLDFKLDNYLDKITELSIKIYGDEDKEKECDRILLNIDLYDKSIIKEILWKVYSFPKNNNITNDFSKNRILKLLIDEDIKSSDFSKNKKPDGNDINPLEDTDEVYNPKNEVQITNDNLNYCIKKIRKDEKIIFIITKIDTNGNQIEIQCDDEELLTKELLKYQFEMSTIENALSKLKVLFLSNTTKYFEEKTINQKQFNKIENTETINLSQIQNIKNEDKEVLEFAIEIVKEIKNNISLNDFIKDKSTIFKIIHDAIIKSKKTESIKNLKKIVNFAIEESINEKDFEDL